MAKAEETPVETGGVAAMTAAEFQFHLEEYKSLRAEIAANIKAGFDAYLYALVSSGGIIAWLIIHKTEIAEYGALGRAVAAGLPLFVTVLAAIITRFHVRNMVRVASYLQKLERRVGAPGLGWEGFHRDTHDRTMGLRFPPSMAAFWGLLALGDIAFAVMM